MRFSPEIEFLPAALEIQETPPMPLARAIIWTILLLVFSALIWACLSKIDIVAVGSGKIIPSGETKLIQPLEIGVVSAIPVHDGQRVKPGDPLLVLDTTQALADETRIRKELEQLRLDVARERAFIEAVHRTQPPRPEWPETSPEQRVISNRQLEADYQSYISQRQALAANVSQRRAEREMSRATLKKLEKTLPIISERTHSLESLANRGLGAKNDYLTLEQERVQTAQDLENERARQPYLEAAIREAEEKLSALSADTEKSHWEKFADAQRQVLAQEQELAKASSRRRQQVLLAPVAGVVQELAVHTVGGVVTPAQKLMSIVPERPELEAEVQFENRDIGFLTQGQSVEVKVDAFPFTRYGTLPGELSVLSGDAILDEKRGLLYGGRIKLHRSSLAIEGKALSLSPGMTVSVEVKTGRRRVIEYVLEPILTRTKEGFGER